ncbi:hypothetical protein BDW22DRAFT_1325503, partial [Trametopsis cervina]
RSLVFDYLCHGAYTNTARAFMRDSVVERIESSDDEAMDLDDGAAPPIIDRASEERLRLAELRKEIRIQILSGRVDDAISLLETYFPGVLSHDPHDHVHTYNLPSSTDTFTYVAPRSVDPTHLLLNLRILAFIEAARTRPLPYHAPGSATPSPDSSSFSLPTIPRTSHIREDSEPNEKQQILLHKAQRLYADANCLPKPEDRAIYLKELANVSALLAYPVPEESTVSQYLEQARREEMAEQIEGAILHRTGDLAVSKIELGVRYTSTVWSWLHSDEANLPPPARWPTGVRPPPSALVADQSGSGKGGEEPMATDRPSSGKKSPEKEGEVRTSFRVVLDRYADNLIATSS